jgi:hypothetical protein
VLSCEASEIVVSCDFVDDALRILFFDLGT